MIGCTKFFKDIPKFIKDVPSLPKSVPRWGTTSNQRKKWTMGRKTDVHLTQGLDVSNFFKDVPRIPKSVLELGTTSNRFPKIPKGINKPWVIR